MPSLQDEFRYQRRESIGNGWTAPVLEPALDSDVGCCRRIKNIGQSTGSTAEEWDLAVEIASNYCKSPKSSVHPLQREILERITHNALPDYGDYHQQG